MTVEDWKPSPWHAELAGLLWLPRMLDKGRRFVESERAGRDLMNGYLFGNSDFVDALLLRFLGTDDRRVRQLLQESTDDMAVAERLVRESHRTQAEIRNWNKRFRRWNAPFIAMMEADEGRRPPGLSTSIYRGVYRALILPPVYVSFRLLEGLRRRRESRG